MLCGRERCEAPYLLPALAGRLSTEVGRLPVVTSGRRRELGI
ncbi:hypothetical protein [Bacteroides gallinarum]|nr:hypothetical protein [Bacteroides gallinarum]